MSMDTHTELDKLMAFSKLSKAQLSSSMFTSLLKLHTLITAKCHFTQTHVQASLDSSHLRQVSDEFI